MVTIGYAAATNAAGDSGTEGVDSGSQGVDSRTRRAAYGIPPRPPPLAPASGT
jgi:hypothetical protein